MQLDTARFLVKEGAKLDFKDHPTDFTAGLDDKKAARKELEKNIERMAELQDVLYAQNLHSLLVIFQAMDAAGKDSAIEHVMSGINPQGCEVTSFKAPSAEEQAHDFLWRCQKALPARGKIGIFNRSHYEEVLVVRVHPAILASERLPEAIKTSPHIWSDRYEQIRNWESMLAANGTKIVKFFLHVSKEEQKKRFLDRIDEQDKNWKFSTGDVKERGFWDDYMNAYHDALEATSTKDAPWYILPADKKWFTRLAVSEILVDQLESLDLKYPQLSETQMTDLLEAKKMLEAEE
jgi:PPK2 family polyphosphate:nucleotide phosphotransferase